MRHGQRHIRLARVGTAATEFAVVLPVLILFALGSADFGRIFHFREAVSNAARSGAQVATSRGFTPFTRAAWEAETEDAVLAELQNLPGFAADDAAIEITVTGEGSELFEVVVSVSCPFRTVVAWPALTHVVVIAERVAMQRSR